MSHVIKINGRHYQAVPSPKYTSCSNCAFSMAHKLNSTVPMLDRADGCLADSRRGIREDGKSCIINRHHYVEIGVSYADAP
jgi:hypothetical protein